MVSVINTVAAKHQHINILIFILACSCQWLIFNLFMRELFLQLSCRAHYALVLTFKCLLLIFAAPADGYNVIIISYLIHGETRTGPPAHTSAYTHTRRLADFPLPPRWFHMGLCQCLRRWAKSPFVVVDEERRDEAWMWVGLQEGVDLNRCCHSMAVQSFEDC